MSLEEEDDFWNSSDTKAFNFDDNEDQHGSATTISYTSSSTTNNAPAPPNSAEVKTLGSILAAKPASNEPFLRPSMIMCNGDKIEQLIEYLDTTMPSIQSIEPKQDPKSYIRDIVDKKLPIDFSPYKSRRDKFLLLDCAMCCSDGNTITAATIFIAKTLKPSIFIEELRRRPIAVDHYMNYLEMTGRTREASDLIEKLSIRN